MHTIAQETWGWLWITLRFIDCVVTSRHAALQHCHLNRDDIQWIDSMGGTIITALNHVHALSRDCCKHQSVHRQ